MQKTINVKRQCITNALKHNYDNIVITRKTKTLSNGKYTSAIVILPSQKVRIAKKEGWVYKGTEPVSKQLKTNWFLFGDYTLDIIATNEVTDYFTHNGKTFVVVSVISKMELGEITSKECKIEVVT